MAIGLDAPQRNPASTVDPAPVETRRVQVNGLESDVVVDRTLLDGILMPILEQLSARRRHRRERRAPRDLVFLVAPPGAGKSTIAALLADRARHLDVDAAGIDGFHFPQSYLDSHHVDTSAGPVPLSEIKGAPETFDLEALTRHLAESRVRDVAWPAYDRVRHDVVADARQVTAGLVLVEGNWLLLDEPGWAGLTAYSRFNILIHAEPELLRQRLVDRKIRGGLGPAAAAEFYERSDRPNVERVLARSDRSRVDLLLHLNADGTIDRGGSQ